MGTIQAIPVPTPTPATDWPGNLRDVIDTQQQTIRFLLGQWNALNAQVAIGGGDFGDVTAFAVNEMVPTGWWQPVTPTTGTIGTVLIGSTTINIAAPAQFWSDGTVKITATGVTLAQVAVMTATTP